MKMSRAAIIIYAEDSVSKKQADSSETLHDSKTIQHFPTPLSKKRTDFSETRRPATAHQARSASFVPVLFRGNYPGDVVKVKKIQIKGL